MSTLTAQVERIQEQLQRLRLIRVAEELPSLLQNASKKDLAYSDFLEEVLSREIAAKHEWASPDSVDGLVTLLESAARTLPG